jgi:hypothetical protein
MDPSTWKHQFTDWSLMTLKPDIKVGKDYYLIDSVSDYMKITYHVAVAPEITIYRNDFQPFKLRCHAILDNDKPPLSSTCLVSEKTNINTFLSFVVKD